MNIQKPKGEIKSQSIKDIDKKHKSKFLQSKVPAIYESELEYLRDKIRKERRKRKKSKFLLAAVEEFINQNKYLLDLYKKMAAHNFLYGFHWNEVISSIIYHKYIKKNRNLMSNYLVIRNKIQQEEKKKKGETTRGMDDVSINKSDYIADNDKNIEMKQTKNNNSTTTTQRKTAKDKVNPDYYLEETDSFGVFGVGGFPSTPPFVATAKGTKQKNNFLKKQGYKLVNNTPLRLGKGKNKLYNTYGDLIKEMEHIKQESLTNPDAMIALMESLISEVEINEHHISPTDREGLITFITTYSDRQEDELSNKTDEEIYAIYSELEKELGLTDESLSDSEVEDRLKKRETMLQEEMKHKALQMLSKLHSKNKQNAMYYFSKEQNKTPEYTDYVEHKDIKKYHPSSEEEEYVALNRGKNQLDAVEKMANAPKEYKDRVKKEAGAYLSKIAEKRKKEENKNPLNTNNFNIYTAPTMKKVNETYSVMGKYIDKFGQPKFVKFELENVEFINETNLPNIKPIQLKGLGNLLSESIEKAIENFSYWIDVKTNKVYVSDKKNILKESIQDKKAAIKELQKMEAIMNYKPKKTTLY